ncbi:DUF5722 domain-containing protein [Verrucomicrobium sp. BvORR034]|uniref:DUF5722 domain-containing protein n=1 Tax=Verrucomicrobium sp. BvORR034 TaxID=1396418 RepID=UPI002240EB62|nr:DUF5722 domain-containing protein [Verrucomicrobium sp. BvORR034]
MACSLTCVSTLQADITLTPLKEGANQVELTPLDNGEWEVRTTGPDPYFHVRVEGEGLDLVKEPILSFEYFSLTGVGRMLVFVGSLLDIPHLVTVQGVGRREGWGQQAIDLRDASAKPALPVRTLRLTWGESPGLVARFRNLKARAATAQEAELAATKDARIKDDRALAERMRKYLSQEFPHQITAVSADPSQIKIEGRVADPNQPWLLAEVPMWEDVTNLKHPAAVHAILADAQGAFTVSVPRDTVKDRDLLLSGWVVVQRTAEGVEPVSALRYVEKQTPRADLSLMQPRSKKGLGGCEFDHEDMDKLGITSVTLNILLNHLLSPTPGEGKTPYTYAGRTWYVNEGVLAGYDRYMTIAARKQLMVSAIILLPQEREAAEGAWIKMAGHPHAEPIGLYVMPNFATQEGAQAYAAAMNLVTERYSRPDGKYGRVHHWIMHNEINSGFYWTNAGDKTDLTYLDLYQKSMRVAWLLAGQYDAHAKSLISLEHGWTLKLDPRAYAGRALLEYLVQFSRKEGDFPWGIAYHPYAEDLRNTRTWEDPGATFDFNAPFITFKNMEVLDAWARLPRVAYQGQPREIQLTEQGLNSPDYSEKTLADQAAGMAYAWKKIESLPTVTAFQYHLWADDRSEGGLRLGLRKFRDDAGDPLGIKPIWHLYQAIGTPEWDKASAFALPILGIKSWDEVPYKGKIMNEE